MSDLLGRATLDARVSGCVALTAVESDDRCTPPQVCGWVQQKDLSPGPQDHFSRSRGQGVQVPRHGSTSKCWCGLSTAGASKH